MFRPLSGLAIRRSAAASLLAVAGFVAASSASAAACVHTYDVNLSLELINIGGDAGTLSGTICTDGTTGVLTAVNIVEWDLTLTNPFLVGAALPFRLSHTGQGATVRLETNYGATPLSATPDELLFDFSPAGTGNFKFFGFEQDIDLPDGLGGTYTQERFFYWYVSASFVTRYYGYDNPDPSPGGGQATYTGNPDNRIGTAPPPTVPEPGALALAGLALAAASAAARRRRGAQARG